MTTPIETWHELVRTKDPKGLDALLADDAVFHYRLLGSRGLKVLSRIL